MKRNPNIFGERPADEDPLNKMTPCTIYSNVKYVAFFISSDMHVIIHRVEFIV